MRYGSACSTFIVRHPPWRGVAISLGRLGGWFAAAVGHMDWLVISFSSAGAREQMVCSVKPFVCPRCVGALYRSTLLAYAMLRMHIVSKHGEVSAALRVVRTPRCPGSGRAYATTSPPQSRASSLRRFCSGSGHGAEPHSPLGPRTVPLSLSSSSRPSSFRAARARVGEHIGGTQAGGGDRFESAFPQGLACSRPSARRPSSCSGCVVCSSSPACLPFRPPRHGGVSA